MSFLVSLISDIVIKILKWILDSILKIIADKKEIENDNLKAKKNAGDLLAEKDREAQRRKSENLLNGD
jgi:hypothetical protein